MRLNEKTYPAYVCLEQKKYAYTPIDSYFGDVLLTDLKKTTDFISSLQAIHSQVTKRYYLTQPFKNAIELAIPKILDKYMDAPSDCGILITDGGFTVYLINPQDKKSKLVCYGFTREKLTTYAYMDCDGKCGGVAASLTKDGKPFNDTNHLMDYINSIFLSVYFIHNCETEQKILTPKEKYRSNGNKYFNESKSNVIILNCNWFTELIRTTPFHVKGHFRMQPCGEGRAKRKLIWVADFEKSGYRRNNQKELK